MSILKKEWFQVTLLLIFFLFLLYTPLAIRIRQTPPERFYTGAEKFYPDFYSMLRFMSQGAMGGWVIKDTETLKDSSFYLVHIEYITLGKLAHALNIPSYVFYFISKIIVSTLIFLFLYKAAFLLNLNRASRFLMVTAGLFLSSPPIFPNFYQPPDMFNLYTQLLHHEMGIFLTLLLFIFFIQKKFLPLLLTALALGIIHSVSAILVVLAVFFFYAVHLRKLKILRRLIIFTTLLIFPLIFYKFLFMFDPSLKEIGANLEKAFSQADLKATSPFVLFSFFFLLSPFIILSIPLVKFFKNLSPVQKSAAILSLVYIVSFVFMHLIGFYFLGISKVRFSLTAYPLAFAILIGLSWSEIQKNRSFKFSTWGLIICILLFSAPTWVSSIQKDAYLFGKSPAKLNEYAYPYRQLMEGVLSLQKLPFGKVLSFDYTGQFLGSFGRQMYYLNTPNYTTNYEEKLNNTTAFYEGKFTPDQAKEFLTRERLLYVFLGPYEWRMGFEQASYKFLTVIYQNPSVIIYKFTP